jgi:hypothetical protein
MEIDLAFEGVRIRRESSAPAHGTIHHLANGCAGTCGHAQEVPGLVLNADVRQPDRL